MLAFIGWSSRRAVQEAQAANSLPDNTWPDYAKLLAELYPAIPSADEGDLSPEAAVIPPPPAIEVFPDSTNADILAVRIAVTAAEKLIVYEQHRRTYGNGKQPVLAACSNYLITLDKECSSKGTELQLAGFGLRNFLSQLFLGAALTGKPLPRKFLDPANFIDFSDYVVNPAQFLAARAKYAAADSRDALAEQAAAVQRRRMYTDAELMVGIGLTVASILGCMENDRSQFQLT